MKRLIGILIAAFAVVLLMSTVLAQEEKLDNPPTGKFEQNATTGEGPLGLLVNNGQSIPPAPPACIPGTTSFANNTQVAIPEGGGTSGSTASMINVAGAGTYLWDLNLTTDITHTWNSDLDITLTSPAGTVVTISTDNGGSNNDVFAGTLWDDDAGDANAPGPVTDHAFANLVVATPLVVEEAMAAFIGENPNGQWTLDIVDDAGGDIGNLNSWSLEITTLSRVPNSGTANFAANPSLPITDGNTTSSNINVGVTGFLSDVNMTTNITHTFGADLEITLTSPQGTVVTISTDNGGGNNDVFAGTLWDDDAGDANPPGPVTDHVYTNLVVATPLVPEEAMGAFIGEDPSGLWTLDIFDDAGADQGTFHSWALELTRADCSVGGVTSFPAVESGGSSGLIAAWTGGAAGALVILAVGGWYTRRRRMVQHDANPLG